jgi:histidyl-tRNA synthetase
MKRADRSGAVACLVLGEAEAENQSLQLKWLKTQEQLSLPQVDLLSQSDFWQAEIRRHK